MKAGEYFVTKADDGTQYINPNAGLDLETAKLEAKAAAKRGGRFAVLRVVSLYSPTVEVEEEAP